MEEEDKRRNGDIHLGRINGLGRTRTMEEGAVKGDENSSDGARTKEKMGRRENRR